MEDIKWFLIGIVTIGGVILFMSLPEIVRFFRKRNNIKNEKFIKTTATIVGGLKASEWVHEVSLDETSRIYKKRLGESFLVFEFTLENGSLVREKSKHAMRANIAVGENVQIAYNPEDLKEIYLLD
jgi:hypothetical protein